MRIELHHYLPGKVSFICILFLWITTLSYAAPAQRLIIHLSEPLNSEQLQALRTELTHTIPISFELRETSNITSWLIIFNQKVASRQIITIKNKLLKNTSIHAIETDQLLETRTN